MKPLVRICVWLVPMLTSISTSLSVAAGVYRWTDANGVVHYADRAPGPALRLDRHYIESRQIAPRSLSVVPREFAEKVRAECRLREERVAAYRSAKQVSGRDPSGRPAPMAPEERQALIQEAAEAARRYCAEDAAEVLWTAPEPPGFMVAP